MKFADIPGQQHAKDGLLKMWHTNTLPHALLLVGQEGVGGLPMALALTSYIFCENKLPNDSCGVCDECRRTNRMEHADMHFSFPTVTKKTGEPSTSKHYLKEFREFVKENPYNNTYNWLQYIKAENKQGNITAQECREIIENLYLKSFQGGKKVLIMWRP
ncbi:MAG: hypothetical protein EBX41_09255, partial [Chitinophagia bacterium]|nr:hypothetical protein [Chitinophagia bacterium]